MITRLIVLEGPDASGKSTLGKFLACQLDYVYVHLSGHKALHVGMYHYHDAVIKMIEWNTTFTGRSFVLDRSWISELVYGTILRPQTQCNFDFNGMKWRYKELNAIYVMCHDDKVKERHKANLDPQHPYNEAIYDQIVNGYFAMDKILHEENMPHLHYDLTKPGAEDAILKTIKG